MQSSAPASTRNLGGLEDEADVGGEGHFARVADETEAGDVGEGMDGKGAAVRRWLGRCGTSLHWDGRYADPDMAGGDYLGGCFIEGGHRLYGDFDPALLGRAFLDRSRDHAGADGFGEDEPVARLGAADWRSTCWG